MHIIFSLLKHLYGDLKMDTCLSVANLSHQKSCRVAMSGKTIPHKMTASKSQINSIIKATQATSFSYLCCTTYNFHPISPYYRQLDSYNQITQFGSLAMHDKSIPHNADIATKSNYSYLHINLVRQQFLFKIYNLHPNFLKAGNWIVIQKYPILIL